MYYYTLREISWPQTSAGFKSQKTLRKTQYWHCVRVKKFKRINNYNTKHPKNNSWNQ